MGKRYSYNKNSSKRIWIDLDDSTQIPFFAPIVKNLEEKGYNVLISGRNYSKIKLLADLYNLDYIPTAKQFDKNNFTKILNSFFRSFQLLLFVIKSKPTIAITHGSVSQMIAAFILRIPIAMFLDYEFIRALPTLIKPNIIFMPNILYNNLHSSFGTKIFSYPGRKEDIYLHNFAPDSNIITNLKIDTSSIIIFIKLQSYKNFDKDYQRKQLFQEIIKMLTNNETTRTIILLQDELGKAEILKYFNIDLNSEKLLIQTEIIDELNLLWHSDIVISDSRSLNREASSMGIPVYNIFHDKLGAVDSHLVKNNRLILIENIKDVRTKIQIKKKQKLIKLLNINSLALQSVSNEIENFISEVVENKLPKIKEYPNEFAKN
jgi:predicted glycosyltransferase